VVANNRPIKTGVCATDSTSLPTPLTFTAVVVSVLTRVGSKAPSDVDVTCVAHIAITPSNERGIVGGGSCIHLVIRILLACINNPTQSATYITSIRAKIYVKQRRGIPIDHIYCI